MCTAVLIFVFVITFFSPLERDLDVRVKNLERLLPKVRGKDRQAAFSVTAELQTRCSSNILNNWSARQERE